MIKKYLFEPGISGSRLNVVQVPTQNHWCTLIRVDIQPLLKIHDISLSARLLQYVMSLYIHAKCFTFLGDMFPEGYKAFCPYCPARFTIKIDLIKHFKEEHGKTPARSYTLRFCDKCSFVSQNCRKNYRKHMECHELAVVYKCFRCLYLSSTRAGILRHAHRAFCSEDDLVMIQESGDSVPLNIVRAAAKDKETKSDAESDTEDEQIIASHTTVKNSEQCTFLLHL